MYVLLQKYLVRILFATGILVFFLLISCKRQTVTLTRITQGHHVEDQGISFLETTLAVNPHDSGNMVIASMRTIKAARIEGSAVFYTTDAGKSWKKGLNLDTNSIDFPGGDPYLTVDSRGNFYFCTIGKFVVWKSFDQGATWKKMSIVPGAYAYDRQWIVADLRDTSATTLYASGKFSVPAYNSDEMIMSISADGGKTFSYPQTFPPKTKNESLNTPMGLHQTENGTLLSFYNVFYMDSIPKETLKKLHSGKGNEIIGKIEAIVSNDNGKSFQTNTVSVLESYGHGVPAKSLKCLSTAGIGSYTTSGTETIYIAWINAINGYCEVVISASQDKGKTWTSPKSIHRKKQFSDMSNVALAVNESGVILVVWNDRRNDPGNTCFQIMGAFSVNGGQSFEAPFIIDTTMSCPCGRDNENNGFDECRWANGGDTQGIATLPSGHFVVSFPSERNGKLELFLARIIPPEKSLAK